MSNQSSQRRAYPSDVSDQEWEFCAPYLTLMTEDAPQRDYDLREVFNGLRYLVRSGCSWRMLPNDLPPWTVVYQQSRRSLRAVRFEEMAHDLRRLVRVLLERDQDPSACVMDGRTLQSTPESGSRVGHDGYKRKKGSKVHIAVDTLGHLLALKVTAANEQERAQVEELAQQVQAATDEKVTITWGDQGYTGEDAAAQAAKDGMELVVVKLREAKRGFVLLPRRWVVERSFAWAAGFRRLGRDYERLAATLAGCHWLAFGMLMLNALFKSQ